MVTTRPEPTRQYANTSCYYSALCDCVLTITGVLVWLLTTGSRVPALSTTTARSASDFTSSRLMYSVFRVVAVLLVRRHNLISHLVEPLLRLRNLHIRHGEVSFSQ